MSCQNQFWLLIRNNVPIYCFKVASFIEAFLNDTTFSLSENVAWQRFVLQIVTFLKIFQGFSLFSYQCSLFCCQPRQLLYCIRCLIACQQLFNLFFCFHRDSHRFLSCLTSQLSYNIMQSNHCQQQISFFCIFFFQQSN